MDINANAPAYTDAHKRDTVIVAHLIDEDDTADDARVVVVLVVASSS
jgi:hypothetical protein